MRYKQYKFKFYLNASHSIRFNGKLGERHPHTWEISINTIKLSEQFIQFNDLENEIDQWLSTYENAYLNDKNPFNVINPTLENCCSYFKEEITKILNEQGWELLVIEMSETPTRSYVINALDDEESQASQNMESLAEAYLSDILK